MHRRGLLSSVGIVCLGGLSGCLLSLSESSETSGDTVIDETIFEGGDGIYRFEAEAGQTVNVYANNEEGFVTSVYIFNPDDEVRLEERVETEAEFSIEAEMSGAWTLQATTGGRAQIEVGVED